MKVNTADLKNNLSRYLARIRRSGDTLIVCDRNKPIATLTPINPDPDEEWKAYRRDIMAKAKKAGLTIDLPVQRPDPARKTKPHPTVALDGRTDIRTIDLVRKGRDY